MADPRFDTKLALPPAGADPYLSQIHKFVTRHARDAFELFQGGVLRGLVFEYPLTHAARVTIDNPLGRPIPVGLVPIAIVEDVPLGTDDTFTATRLPALAWFVRKSDGKLVVTATFSGSMTRVVRMIALRA